MTLLLLVRHGDCDPVGRSIAGRAPGVQLNSEGRRQVEELARAIAPVRLEAIYTSPLERARETAEALAQGRRLAPIACAELVEIEFGRWTGKTLAELASDPGWHAFNRRRGTTRIPGGESMADVVARGSQALDRIREDHPEGTVAAVSHGDVIRALIVHVLGLPLDRMLGFEAATASVSVLELFPGHSTVRSVNWRVGRPV